MNRTLLLLICCSCFLYGAAQPSTVNLTPFGSASTMRYTRIVTSRTGDQVFLYGNNNGKAQFLVKDGPVWRDITKGFRQDFTITEMKIALESVLLVSGNGQQASYTAAYGWSGPYPFTVKEFGSRTPAAYYYDRTTGLEVVAGRWEGPMLKKFYAARQDNKGEWERFMDKKMDAATQALFDTYTMTHVASAGKEDVYLILQSLTKDTSLLMKWNGKTWKQVAMLPGTNAQMIATTKGWVYINSKTAEGTQTIFAWDGKELSDLSKALPGGKILPGEGVMTFDGPENLLVGTAAVSGNAATILRWNGHAWTVFGSLPNEPVAITFTKEGVLAVTGSAVYAVPEAGIITAETDRQQQGAKDKKINEINALYADFMTDYHIYHQPLIDALNVLSKDSDKDNVTIVDKANGMLWMQFTVPMRKRLETLALQPGENPFADYLKDNISASSYLYSGVDYLVKTLRLNGTTAADVKRDHGYMMDMNARRTALIKTMPEEYLSYVLKNDLHSIAIDYKREQMRLDSASKATTLTRFNANAVTFGANSAISELNQYLNGTAKEYHAQAQALAKNLTRYNYDDTERQIGDLRRKITDGIDRILRAYEKNLPADKYAEFVRIRTQVGRDYELPPKSTVR